MEKIRGSTKFIWPREAIYKLIVMWQVNECLYNPEHELFHDKTARYMVMKQMAENFKEFSLDIGEYEVKNKIKYLRGQYTREIFRYKEKSRAGEEVYVTSVFWFRQMGFLENFVYFKTMSNRSYREPHFEQVDDSSDSAVLFECNTPSARSCKRARVNSNTPVSDGSVSQENVTQLVKNIVQESYAMQVKDKVIDKDEALCNYIKMEINEITNPDIKDELIEQITLAVFKAKKNKDPMTKTHIMVLLTFNLWYIFSVKFK